LTIPGDERFRASQVHTTQVDEFESRYQALTTDPYSSVFAYGRRKIAALVDHETANHRAGTRAVDVGCGTGFDLARMRNRGFEVVGVEPSAGMRRQARRNNPDIPIIDADIRSLPFENGSLDLVVAIEVIRYLPEPAAALAELARVLRRGGTAVVTAAPRWSLNGYALINHVTSRVRVPTFTPLRQSFLSSNSGVVMLQRAGFSEVVAHGAFLGPWRAQQRLSPRLAHAALRRFERIDEALADRRRWIDLTNHLIFFAKR
jgi:SAM-dependent methyltransferase